MIKSQNNPNLGYYTVGNKVFYNKHLALLESTKTGDFPHWNFNREVYQKIDTTVEPETNLRELYRIRAQQLRNKYDWIRLEFSGGSDSTTVLYSFINNGIHIDEVVYRFPAHGTQGLDPDPKNTKPENTLSEYEYAAKPVLQHLATHFPQIKITVHDFSKNIIDYKGDESWIYNAKDYLHPEHVFKHAPLGAEEHQRAAEADKTICVLYGIEKPRVCIRDGRWYMYFLDLNANHAQEQVDGHSNITTEYFYWQPDVPEITIKQAHIVKNWFESDAGKPFQFLVRWPNHSATHRTTYEQVVKVLIYPDYDPTTWQTAKSTNAFYAEMNYWFFRNFKDTEFYQVWQAGLAHVTNTVDPKFFNYEMGKPVGFVGFLDRFYDLGPSTYINTDITKELLK